MESLWKLTYLLEPASLALVVTAIFVTFASASRALDHGKEMERNLDFSEASITLDRSQALMIPLASSCSLLLMFYLFSSMSHLVTAFTAIASASALFFCFSPYVAYIKSQFNLMDPFVSRCCSKSFTRSQGILLLLCIGIVVAWLVSGHWVLNNLLGISICIAFVSHVRLPNIKICTLLLVCLFVYDIFWVFFSERFFGANVMVSVATQKASNPVHTVANSLSLPGLQLITKKLELPVKLVFPRNLMGGLIPGSTAGEYMMLGLGDMAIPGMLLALVLCFDHQKNRDTEISLDTSSSKGHKYIWYGLSGYAVGLITALAAGILSQSPQPALLYLVFSYHMIPSFHGGEPWWNRKVAPLNLSFPREFAQPILQSTPLLFSAPREFARPILRSPPLLKGATTYEECGNSNLVKLVVDC
ncbi:signal peptide peptidase-like 1 isoform X2 [Elaeis guineensis]|uniref:signal peptide peptidase-like 1 isoform X2 n=1 Tax=Elaeis guineensis var. tenera TaxID=51953 RepID=UPI003C6D67F0